MRTRPGRPRGLKAVSIAVTTLAVAGGLLSCTGGTATSTPSGSWPYPNGDLANTRVAPGSSITAQNVATLRKAWSFKLTGKAATNVGHYGSLAANPIIENGTVYIQDLECNVYALNLSNGALEWEYTVDRPEKSGPGPNGVAVADTVVYGLTPTSAFALNAKTGKRIWINTKLLTKGEGTFGIQPEVATGHVYLASQYGSGPGGGVLMSLDASTGALLWKFRTAIGRDPGVEKLGVGTGGAWETPLVGADGSVTYGIGNPYQSVRRSPTRPGSSTPTATWTSQRRRGSCAGTTRAFPTTSWTGTCRRPRSLRQPAASLSSSAAARWATSTR